MIELTEKQRQALDGPEPICAVDPATGQEYLVVRRKMYEKMWAFLKPLSRPWDNPADDNLTKPCKENDVSSSFTAAIAERKMN